MDLLQRLEIIEDVKRMRARYGRAVDTRDWEEIAASWAPDGMFERGQIAWRSANPLPTASIFSGRDEILGMLKQAGEGLSFVHHLFMPEIEIEHETKASGIWAMHSITRLASDLSTKVIEVAGYYHETYERQGARWVIKSVRPERLQVITY